VSSSPDPCEAIIAAKIVEEMFTHLGIGGCRLGKTVVGVAQALNMEVT